MKAGAIISAGFELHGYRQGTRECVAFYRGATLQGHEDAAPAMPLSSKEKQEAFRARNAMLGLTEVRGVFLPPALHQELKEIAAKLLKADQRRQDQADTERREVK